MDYYITCLYIVLCGVLGFSSYTKQNKIDELKSEAIKRGYAEMVLQSSTSNKAIFKWKEK